MYRLGRIVIFFFLYSNCLFSLTLWPFKREETRKGHSTKWVSIQEHLHKAYPVRRERSLVAMVIFREESIDAKKVLDSLFSQSYPSFKVLCVANGLSTRIAKELAERIAPFEKGGKAEFICYEELTSNLEILYDLVHRCDPQEIVVLLKEGEWLSHPDVFEHLNSSYAHPEVWVTSSRSLSAPDYQTIKGGLSSDSFLVEKGFRKQEEIELEGVRSFYAGFFQKIPLRDFLMGGSFLSELTDLSWVLPMLEMGYSHFLFLEEISTISPENAKSNPSPSLVDKWVREKKHLASLPPHRAMHHWDEGERSFYRWKSDLVVFSVDHPLHLYATLESLGERLLDVEKSFVIYQASTPIFERAYLEVEAAFPQVSFLAVCNHPKHSFRQLLKKTLRREKGESPYLVLLHDHLFLEREISLHRCIESLEAIRANHFIFHLHSSQMDPYMLPVVHKMQGTSIVGRQIERIDHGLENVGLLCRKDLLEKNDIDGIPIGRAFSKLWSQTIDLHQVVLFFDAPRIALINTKGAVLQEDKKEWAYKFLEGRKIDLHALTQEPFAYSPKHYPLVKRQGRRKNGFGKEH